MIVRGEAGCIGRLLLPADDGRARQRPCLDEVSAAFHARCTLCVLRGALPVVGKSLRSVFASRRKKSCMFGLNSGK